jgi:hypothetical protein
MPWLNEVIRDYFICNHRVIVDGDIVFWFPNDEVKRIDCKLVASLLKVLPPELADFITWLSHWKQIPGLTEMVNEFVVVLRSQNLVTIPKDLLDRLKIPHPAYGTLLTLEIKKVVLRDMTEISYEQATKLLGGEKV